MNDFLKGAPREIDRADVLGELLHRFEKDDPNNAISWVLDTLTELDILKFRAPVDDPSKDPVGTVRREKHDEGFSVWLASLDHNEDRYWVCVYSTAPGNRGQMLEDRYVGDTEVVSCLWGTPAAEAETREKSVNIAVLREKIRREEIKQGLREPRVFRSDGPEPPAGVDKLEAVREVNGWTHLHRDGEHWRWANASGVAFGAQDWPASPVPVEFREVSS